MDTSGFDLLASTFGVDLNYLVAAALFIFLHVQTIKGLWTGFGRLSTLTAVLVCSALYHLTVLAPAFGVHYYQIALPTVIAMGSWETIKIVIAKAKSK